jgi:WD40 repeat protein
VRGVAFSPDDKYILTASFDVTARLWFNRIDDTVHAVCDLLIRDLTSGERAQVWYRGSESNLPSAINPFET